jgi:hypothetical protein
MDQRTQMNLTAIYSEDRELQNIAFHNLILETDQPVLWAYEVWDGLVSALKHRDNHVRAIAAQVLCNLAKSDPQKRMLKDFPALIALTHDERFVTARHCLQALWKVGVAGDDQLKQYLHGLTVRFAECADEKNGTLTRYDICQSLNNTFDVVHAEIIKETALRLIETETDLKYRKKYASLWRSKA